MKKFLLSTISIFVALTLLACATTNPTKTANTTTKQTANQSDKNTFQELIIDASTKTSLPTALKTGSFYNIQFNLPNEAYSLFKVDVLNEKNKAYFSRMITPPAEGKASQKIYLSDKAVKLKVSVKPVNSDEFEEIATFDVKPVKIKQNPAISHNKKTGITTVKIDATNLNKLPKTLVPGLVYKFEVDLPEFEYEYCLFEMAGDEIKAFDYFAHQEDGRFIHTLYIPKTIKNFNIFLKSSPWNDDFYACFFKMDAPVDSPLPVGDDFLTAYSYLKDKPDQRILDYLDEINAREKCKNDPFEVLLLSAAKIQELAQDDFEKVVLINDTIWYLLSYDMQVIHYDTNGKINFVDFIPQDYITDLKRGVCVCEGFTKTFSEMCILMDLPYLESLSSIPNLLSGGHIWNLVQIEGKWYLIDVTWNATQTLNGQRNDRYTSEYLFMGPQQFLNCYHFPNYIELQLLNPPVSIQGYFDMVRK